MRRKYLILLFIWCQVLYKKKAMLLCYARVLYAASADLRSEQPLSLHPPHLPHKRCIKITTGNPLPAHSLLLGSHH